MDSTTTRTIAVTCHGFSSSPPGNHRHGGHLISRQMNAPRSNLYSVYSPRSGRFFNGRFEEQPPHFLDACFLCKKPLGCNRDIFMYRGDTPFCSDECRAEQIWIDESKEKKRSLSASMKALRKKEENSSPNYPCHSGAVATA